MEDATIEWVDIVLVVDKATKLEGVEIAEEDIFLLVVLMVELVSVELIVVVIKNVHEYEKNKQEAK